MGTVVGGTVFKHTGQLTDDRLCCARALAEPAATGYWLRSAPPKPPR